MRHFILIAVLCIGIPTGAGAQTFTQRLQKKPATGQGSVTIHQSDSIDQLVNTTVLTTKTSTPTTTKTSTPSTGSQTGSTIPNSHSNTTNQAHQASKAVTPVSTPAEVTDTTTLQRTRTHKVMGYRVQAFAGGNSRKDRQQAEQVRNSIKSHYPNVPVYVHFYSPRWICRVGNYRTYEEAHQMLVSLRELGFEQLTIVKGKITVAN